jgi:uncharacterized membrane protein (UPF0127 family)
MEEQHLLNERSGALVASQVAMAGNAWSRGVGLLPRATVSPDEGVWIRGCNAVHTMLMRATIDLFFLDKDDRVLKIVRDARPNRLAFTCSKAKSVVEIGSGGVAVNDVLIGDRLTLG